MRTKTLSHSTHEFGVVNEWPFGGYKVWNIGRNNFPYPGYIPLCQDGKTKHYINTDTLKALFVGDEELCLKVLKYAGQHGCDEDTFNKIKKGVRA